ITLAGHDLVGTPPYKRQTNMMFQSYALFPHMSVEKNIAFGLEQDNLPKGDIEARVQEMLKLVKLEQFAKRKPSQLSGGQRQRVALARSLAKRPKVLLLDEPLGALDKKLRTDMQIELQNLQRELGITFVLVTHDQEEALSMSDVVCVMNGGRIVQLGAPDEIYDRPADRFVAAFVGKTNFLDGTVVENGGGAARIRLANGMEIGARLTGGGAPGAAVSVSLRPEALRLGAATGETGLGGIIRNRIFLGSTAEYAIEVPHLGTLLATADHDAARSDLLKPGDSVAISFNPGAPLAFPAADNKTTQRETSHVEVLS
ncbi:MAG: ABC transporter ATP-binding protein, partial [Starkeya sp.]|nr:ABC transporter ATP-binding protein [Starkeya sp.]